VREPFQKWRCSRHVAKPMYKHFFGLTRSPFELSPDPSFMCSLGRSEEALASIYHAILQRKGFIVLTGEVGTGKTLVVRYLCDLWKDRGIPFANIMGPGLSVSDFLSYLIFDLGIEVKEPTKGNLLRAFYSFLLAQHQKGLTTVLIIDEAHQVHLSVLEEIRMLTNFETAHEKLLQVLLVGQPEFDERLDSFELRPLKQRVAIRCKLEPLGEEETRGYIEARLKLAGANSQARTIFPAETVSAIYRYSSGIPRMLNNICDQALMAAYAQQIPVVPVEIIDDIASYFRLQPNANLGRRETLSAQAEHRANPHPEISWRPEPALDLAVEDEVDPNGFSSSAEAPTELRPEATGPSKPETSFISIGSKEPEGVQPLAMTTTISEAATMDADTHCPTTALSNSGANLSPALPVWPVRLAPTAEWRGAAQVARLESATTSSAIKKRLTRRKNSRSIIAGIALLSILVGAGTVLFRSGTIGKAAGTAARELPAPPVAIHVGEGSSAQTEPSTRKSNPAPDLKPASESLRPSPRLPKPKLHLHGSAAGQ
jgi:general secretion pathway protein A